MKHFGIHLDMVLRDLLAMAHIKADPRRPKAAGCTPKPATKAHPGRNQQYNGQGNRYFERSRYVPHQGAGEIARRMRQAETQSRKLRRLLHDMVLAKAAMAEACY